MRGTNAGMRVNAVLDGADEATLGWGCCSFGTAFAQSDPAAP